MYQRLITEITHGARQACCVTEFIRSRLPEPTSEACVFLAGRAQRLTKPHSDEYRARTDELMQRDEDALVLQRLHADKLRRDSMTAGASGDERRDPDVEMVGSGLPARSSGDAHRVGGVEEPMRTAAEDADTRRGLNRSAELPLDDGARDRAPSRGERIDGESMEFEWKIFQGFSTFGLLKQIQEFMKEEQCDPEQFTGSIIFMSMFNDITWREKENEEKCISNAHEVANYALRFLRGHWSFLGPGSEKKSYGTSDKPDGVWDRMAEEMLLNFSESGHPIFRATSALERRELRSKVGGKKTIHFNGNEQNVELILRTVISANQLSIYGAVADMCTEVSKDTTASGKPEAHDPLETMEIPTEPPTADPRTDEQRRRNLLQEHEQQFEQLSDDQKKSKLCSNAVLKTVERGEYFIALDAEGPSGMAHLCRECTMPRNDPRTRARGLDS